MDAKLEYLVRSLFSGNGFLDKCISQQPGDFLDNFVKREAVELATKKFVTDIRTQFDETLKQQHTVESEDLKDMQTNEEQTTPVPQLEGNSSTKMITSSGIKSTENFEIRKFDLQSLEDNPTTLPKTVKTDAITTPPITESAPQPLKTSLSSDIKPGDTPPADSQQPNKPISGLEQSRTTFSINANGKANIDFRGKIVGKCAVGSAVVISDVVIPPDLGLMFDVEMSELHGIPLLAGEFPLTVHFQFDPVLPTAPKLHHGVCNLIVNPDPKTLWKNEPSDKNGQYCKEDEDILEISANDGLRMIAASKRGRSHAHVGSYRDDDFCLMQDEESGWRVITVADGAGSAKLSRKGSLLASRIATESVMKALAGEKGRTLDKTIVLFEADPIALQKLISDELYYLFWTAAKEAVHAIDIEAKLVEAVYKDFSTTLIITIHKKVATGHFVAAYWVGDGGVAVYREGKEVTVLGKADSGEFAGQTRFLDAAMLDSQQLFNRIEKTIVPDFTAIIAMTDGITDPKFETDANIENRDKWDELWSELSPVVESANPAPALLNWLDFWSPGNHDDRTIAILYPAKPGVATTAEVAE